LPTVLISAPNEVSTQRIWSSVTRLRPW